MLKGVIIDSISNYYKIDYPNSVVHYPVSLQSNPIQSNANA
jgi:hypothetical protein